MAGQQPVNSPAWLAHGWSLEALERPLGQSPCLSLGGGDRFCCRGAVASCWETPPGSQIAIWSVESTYLSWPCALASPFLSPSAGLPDLARQEEEGSSYSSLLSPGKTALLHALASSDGVQVHNTDNIRLLLEGGEARRGPGPHPLALWCLCPYHHPALWPG